MKFLLAAIVFVLFFVSTGFANAWDWDAHRYIARQALAPLLLESPVCAGAADEGSVFPDNVSRDFANHHCYNSVCPVNDSSYCPQKLDCPAVEKARRLVVNASREEGCAKIFSLAVASHYLSDAVDVMHEIVNEDYEGCHKPFEDKVGDAVKKNPNNFSITQCCNAPNQCFSLSASDLQRVIAFVKQEIGLQDALTPTRPTSSLQPSELLKENIKENTLSELLDRGKKIVNNETIKTILVFLAVFLLFYVLFNRKRLR